MRGILEHHGMQELERDEIVGLDFPGPVHLAHGAAADHLDHLEPAQAMSGVPPEKGGARTLDVRARLVEQRVPLLDLSRRLLEPVESSQGRPAALARHPERRQQEHLGNARRRDHRGELRLLQGEHGLVGVDQSRHRKRCKREVADGASQKDRPAGGRRVAETEEVDAHAQGHDGGREHADIERDGQDAGSAEQPLHQHLASIVALRVAKLDQQPQRDDEGNADHNRRQHAAGRDALGQPDGDQTRRSGQRHQSHQRAGAAELFRPEDGRRGRDDAGTDARTAGSCAGESAAGQRAAVVAGFDFRRLPHRHRGRQHRPLDYRGLLARLGKSRSGLGFVSPIRHPNRVARLSRRGKRSRPAIVMTRCIDAGLRSRDPPESGLWGARGREGNAEREASCQTT